jgi:NAD(P)H dehydrogenase (quinone)
MFVITGITGRVGGQVASSLLAQGHKIRAVVRTAAKGEEWSAKGCEVSIANLDDATALTEAFRGAEGVFLMTPPNYDPEPGFPDTERNAAAIREAIEAALPEKVVFLSTVGAHVAEFNLLNNSSMTEAMLRTISVPVAFVRAAWFMENASWDVESAKTGVVKSFLQPLDHKIPMIATQDIAQSVVELLGEIWQGERLIELEAQERYSAADIAAAFASALGTPVRAEIVPRSSWEELFRSQGMTYPQPRIRMLDGFNERWIEFERAPHTVRKGTTELAEVIKSLVQA